MITCGKSLMHGGWKFSQALQDLSQEIRKSPVKEAGFYVCVPDLCSVTLRKRHLTFIFHHTTTKNKTKQNPRILQRIRRNRIVPWCRRWGEIFSGGKRCQTVLTCLVDLEAEVGTMGRTTPSDWECLMVHMHALCPLFTSRSLCFFPNVLTGTKLVFSVTTTCFFTCLLGWEWGRGTEPQLLRISRI